MDILGLFKSLFDMGKSFADLFNVRTKPQEIQVGEFKEKEKLREQDFNQEMIEDDFDYIKKRPELDILNTLKQNHPNMEISDGYVQLITERVTAFRQDVVRRKGWRWKRHKEWLEANGRK